MHDAQRCQGGVGLGGVQALQCARPYRGGLPLDGGQFVLGSWQQVDPVGPAVCRIGAALHQTGLGQLVNQSCQCDGLQLHGVGQVDLPHAFLPRHVDQGAGLRQG